VLSMPAVPSVAFQHFMHQVFSLSRL